MSTEAPDADSYLSTKRWFARYPGLGAPGIPVEPFISEEHFHLERQRLWPNVWLMTGRAEHIPEPGDYFIKDIPPLNASLIVVRGRDRVVRAFHNVCPHRGSQLCWEKSGTRSSTTAFKCPYHGFTFDLEGILRFVPDEENFYGLDKQRTEPTSLAIREVRRRTMPYPKDHPLYNPTIVEEIEMVKTAKLDEVKSLYTEQISAQAWPVILFTSKITNTAIERFSTATGSCLFQAS